MNAYLFTDIILYIQVYKLGVRQVIDKTNDVPYYLQIYNVLKERIDTGIYESNILLPSENMLVEEFQVTRITLRNAIKKLKDEGRIYTEKGKGSYINPPKIEQSLFKFYSFGRNYTDKDWNANTSLISINTSSFEAEAQNKLALTSDKAVTQIIRLRKLDTVPVIVETSYIPTDLVLGINSFDFEKNSIYDILEQHYKLKIVKAKEYLDPCVTDTYYSNLLEVSKGTPVFITERITYSNNEIPIEFRKSIIRSDKFRFSVELR